MLFFFSHFFTIFFLRSLSFFSLTDLPFSHKIVFHISKNSVRFFNVSCLYHCFRMLFKQCMIAVILSLQRFEFLGKTNIILIAQMEKTPVIKFKPICSIPNMVGYILQSSVWFCVYTNPYHLENQVTWNFHHHLRCYGIVSCFWKMFLKLRPFAQTFFEYRMFKWGV